MSLNELGEFSWEYSGLRLHEKWDYTVKRKADQSQWDLGICVNRTISVFKAEKFKTVFSIFIQSLIPSFIYWFVNPIILS